MSVLWTPLRLVVEDNERAAKADGVTKELPHINGGPVPRSFAVHVQAAQAARHKFTIPRIPTAPAFPTFVPNAVQSANAGCSGDTVDTSASTLQVKTKLKSFTDGKEYYHDARFLQTEICNSHLGSSGEPIERDDEGEHPRDDNVHPRRPDLKEGSAMYVDLPQKPLRADVQHVALEMLVDRHNDQPKEHKCLKHPHNNNKEYEEEESSCIVECLYCCIQCCDCSIM